jgi:signal transduction histidine kinase
VLGVLDAACGVLSDLDVDVVLERVLEAARELTGAEYAALGVLDRSRTELERFITAGLDEPTRGRIGALPRGRGVLGALIADPRPLRLADVGTHPYSYGFPSGHPPMKTFIGVPLLVAGEPFGNLYLTEKRHGAEFTEEDELALVRLAELAGVAIDHARRYTSVEKQRSQLNRTVKALDAMVQIARAIGGETDLETILELVAKRGRALVSARALVIEHGRGDEIVVAAGAGELVPGVIGQTVDIRDSVAAAALRISKTLRLEEDPNRARFERHGLGRYGLHAHAGLVVPLIFRSQAHGVLIAVDRVKNGPAFTSDDQQLLEAFAASAATAIATARSVELERTSQRLAAAEQERGRWARELHDETLQNLAALRIGLAIGLRAGDPVKLMAAVRDAVDQLESEIADLRSMITDLRPTALDDADVATAIEALAERSRRHGLEVDTTIDLGIAEEERYSIELETAVYRIAQEALTNARKHGGARRALIDIHAHNDCLYVTVDDDGHGFDPEAKSEGFGLHGMRERAEFLGGTLTINSEPGRGTQIIALLPTRHASTRRASRVTRSGISARPSAGTDDGGEARMIAKLQKRASNVRRPTVVRTSYVLQQMPGAEDDGALV